MREFYCETCDDVFSDKDFLPKPKVNEKNPKCPTCLEPMVEQEIG